MEHAGMTATGFFRFIQTHQQKGEKCHVIAQSQSAELGALGPDSPANTAINPGISFSSGFFQFF
jgi:hypothetical protein